MHIYFIKLEKGNGSLHYKEMTSVWGHIYAPPAFNILQYIHVLWYPIIFVFFTFYIPEKNLNKKKIVINVNNIK